MGDIACGGSGTDRRGMDELLAQGTNDDDGPGVEENKTRGEHR